MDWTEWRKIYDAVVVVVVFKGKIFRAVHKLLQVNSVVTPTNRA